MADILHGFSTRNLHQYSIVEAMRGFLQNGSFGGFEAEVSREIELRTGRKSQGLFVPTNLPMERRTVLDATQGAGAIPTNTDTSNWVDALRAKSAVLSMGAKYITGLAGNLHLPKTTQTATATWQGDGVAPSASNEVVGTVAFAPNTMSAYVDLSRNYLVSAGPASEQFVRDDLLKVVATELDRAALNGSGSASQPTGVLQQGSLSVTSLGTNGGPLTFAKCVALESAVAAANADGSACGYITNSKVRAQLKTTLENPTYGSAWTWKDSPSPIGTFQTGIVNGYRAACTNNMPSNLSKASGTGLSAMIFGDWSQLVIGQWGFVEIMPDPYTGSKSGMLRLVVLSDVDIQVKHIEGFGAVVDCQA